ncbi:MAG: adenine phosphoribosyltransferase [Paracoccaceae bacterium]|jgi:adenine phosphoribosyltransferase|nr:adenine phosphoribosyltransferase [Paracoccaceae bacterium]
MQHTKSDFDKGPREDRWYLNIMAPNTKGDKFAWLDPTSIYINGTAFSDLLDDLMADLEGVHCDVVAGMDAMGFVLGAGLAGRMCVGFLPIRKAGKLCVETDVVTFQNYSGRVQEMEMRDPVFAAGTRVLLADQWVETGGTMVAGIELVERQNGVVVGLASIAIEENARTLRLRQTYPCASAVVPGSRWQAECNNQTLSSFASYSPEIAFPRLKSES